jgi:hypothetical protein
VPVKKDFKVRLDEKISFLLKANEAVQQTTRIFRLASNMGVGYEWKYLATSKASCIEEGFGAAALHRTGARRRHVEVAQTLIAAAHRRPRGDRRPDAGEPDAQRR